MARSLPAALALGAIVAACSVAAPTGDALAQEPKSKPHKERRKNFGAGEWAYKKLGAAHEALEDDQFAGALSIMDEMSKRKSLSDHEKALMNQTYGYIHSAQGRYEQAIRYFEKCLSLDAMPRAAMLGTQYNVGQLYMSVERYKDAAKALESWIDQVENPAASAYYLIGMAHLQLQDAERALPYARKAVKKSKKPREPYLYMALSLEFEAKNLKHVSRLLEVLVAYFPKKSYYLQLSATYAERGRDRSALSALELAYIQGFLTQETELINLAQAYLFHEVPYKAAQVLEKGIYENDIAANSKNLQMLGDAWLHAREYEKSLEPLRKAAGLSGDGNLFIRIAQVHLERDENDQALSALQKGLAKGGLDNPGDAYLLVGITQAGKKNFGPAREAFAKAGNYEKNRRVAKRWVKHVERQEAASSQ